MTTCRVCQQNKDASDFYPRQVRKAGDIGECKDCTKARVRHRSRNNESVREYDRQRSKEPHRRAHTSRVARQWNAKNPLGYAAHNAVSNALRDGRLAKEPCLFCGADRVHAHHRDYSRPLDVVWLCPKCHHRLHKTFPETEAIKSITP